MPPVPHPSDLREARQGTAPLFIRADAGAAIGNGHVVRCMALAACWREHGAAVTFLSHAPAAALRRAMAASGARWVEIERPHPDPSDLAATLASIAHAPGALVLTDGARFTDDYRCALRRNGARLLVLDDNAAQPHYSADALINPNAHAPSLRYRTSPGAVEWLGARYALLRPPFRMRRDARPAQQPHLLVTFGGTDPARLTAPVVTALLDRLPPELHITAVLAHGDPQLSALAPLRERVRVVVDADAGTMAALMAGAAAAVSAASGTALELACMGVPMLLVAVADDQRRAARTLADAGAAVDLGWHEGLTAGSIAEAAVALLADRARRGRLSERGRALVDGEGAERVFTLAQSFAVCADTFPNPPPPAAP